MKLLGNIINKNIRERKYFSVDKVLKDKKIKNTKIGYSSYTKNTMLLPKGWMWVVRSERPLWQMQRLKYSCYISITMESEQNKLHTINCYGIDWILY